MEPPRGSQELAYWACRGRPGGCGGGRWGTCRRLLNTFLRKYRLGFRFLSLTMCGCVFFCYELIPPFRPVSLRLNVGGVLPSPAATSAPLISVFTSSVSHLAALGEEDKYSHEKKWNKKSPWNLCRCTASQTWSQLKVNWLLSGVCLRRNLWKSLLLEATTAQILKWQLQVHVVQFWAFLQHPYLKHCGPFWFCWYWASGDHCCC